MKILFLTSRLPFPPVGGDKLRTYHFIKHLQKFHDVTVISFIEDETELSELHKFEGCYKNLITIKLTKLKSYLQSFVGLMSYKPLQVHYYVSSKMSNVVNNELKSNNYDIIFCHLIRMAQYLPKTLDIRKVVDFTDAISLNYKRSELFRKGIYGLINKIESKRVYKYEKKILFQTDMAIFISEVDSNFLKENRTNHKIKILGNGVDLKKFPFYYGAYNARQLVFLGNMRTFPNTDAVMYFIEDILPLVKYKIPDIKLFVVGAEPNNQLKKLHDGKNIFITGFVSTVLPFLNHSVAMIAPMRVGAGIQNKILESMAVGTPVITTDIGAEGLDPSELLIGNSPNEIASLIFNTINNPSLRNEIAVNARKYIETHFEWNDILHNLDKYLVNMTSPQNKPQN